MPAPKKATRSNIKSTSPEIDRILLRHLTSPHRFKGVTYLNKKGLLPSCQEEKATEKNKNRLACLKVIQDQDISEFLHLCSAHQIDISDFTQPRKDNIEASDSDSDSDSDSASDEEEDHHCYNKTQAAPHSFNEKMSKTDNNSRGKKCLAAYPDGRHLGVCKLMSGFDEARAAFRVGDCKKKIVLRTKKPNETQPDPIENANVVLKRHGFDDESVHVVSLQAQIDDTANATPDECIEQDIFSFDEEIKTSFVDQKGRPFNSVHIESDENGSEWACFWVMGVNVKPENLTDASVVRNKKRSNQGNKELLELTSQFNAQMQQANAQMQQATNEKANMEHQMAKMQAQIEHMMGINNNDAAMPDQAASC
jgi:hypothetical protein